MSINNKKITKVHGIVVVTPLSPGERTLLREVTLGHGKLKAAASYMGLSRQTLYNVMDENYTGDFDVDTLNAIRKFLSQTNKKVA